MAETLGTLGSADDREATARESVCVLIISFVQ
jgi:hypothetical protein